MRSVIIIVSATFLLLFLGYEMVDRGWIQPVHPGPLRFPVRGVDVSHHQGEIDWKKLREENIDFAYIKATEGSTHVDRLFAENWNQAAENGIVRGAYLFYSLRFGGEEQALNFIRTVPKEQIPVLPPAVDLEYGGNSKIRPTPEELRSEVNKCMNMLEEHYGMKPVIYAPKNFYNDYVKDYYTGHGLWLRNLMFYPRNSQMLFWQYYNRGKLEGVNHYIDLNVFDGTREEFNALIRQDSQ